MPHEKSMVGRMFDAAGRDLGDAKFWERDMGVTPQTEAEMLAENKRKQADAAMRQAEDIIQRNPELSAKLYAELAKLYPEDPRSDEWKKKSEE